MSTTAPSNISLVFLDIDGTLIDSAFKIQEEVRTTIETCSKQGVKFALASGRPLFGAADVLKQLPISAPSVFFSGGLVYDPIRKQTLHQSTLEPEIVRALIDTAHSADIYIELYTVDNYFIEATTDLTALHARYLNRHPVCTDLRRLATQDQILKVVMIANGHSEQDKLRELLSSNQHVSCGYASGAGDPDILFANLSSRDANRAATFELVLKYLELTPEKVMAIGDGESDMPFILRAGVGVAMGNAPDQVKQIANFITEDVENAGVALALNRFIL